MEPDSGALMSVVEEMGLLFEQYGASRMMGRVIGWLLVCDPPEQSSADLARALLVSKASISMATRALFHMGIIERVARPGERGVYFRLRPDTFGTTIIGLRLEAMRRFRQLLERGLATMQDAPAARRERLEAARVLFAFFERELERIQRRWETGEWKEGDGRA